MAFGSMMGYDGSLGTIGFFGFLFSFLWVVIWTVNSFLIGALLWVLIKKYSKTK